VEIARALAGDPSLLLLDEPAAGLSMSELDGLRALIQEIADLGATIVIVEHHLDLVASLATTVSVLERGRVIASGPADEVFADAHVLDAYMAADPSFRESSRVSPEAPLLEVNGLSSGYGRLPVLREVSLTARAGEIVALVGGNGAGKSTLLKTLSGLLPMTAGSIVWEGVEIGGRKPGAIVDLGLLHVAEGRRLFRGQSVENNLDLGVYGSRLSRDAERRRLDEVLGMFPMLAERRGVLAGALSGGQQQMLAIAQALMRTPRLLMLDEPSLGLAPIVVDQVFELLLRLRDQGCAVLLVEQLVERALEVAEHAVILQNGRVVASGKAADLRGGAELARAYLTG